GPSMSAILWPEIRVTKSEYRIKFEIRRFDPFPDLVIRVPLGSPFGIRIFPSRTVFSGSKLRLLVAAALLFLLLLSRFGFGFLDVLRLEHFDLGAFLHLFVGGRCDDVAGERLGLW